MRDPSHPGRPSGQQAPTASPVAPGHSHTHNPGNSHNPGPSPAPETLGRTLTIVNRRGLHARASARFVQTAEGFDAEITVARDGLSVGGQSIMGLMMLAAAQGTTIEVHATGRQGREALEAISALVEDGFGEES